MTTPTWYGSIGILERRSPPRRRRWSFVLSSFGASMVRTFRRKRSVRR